MYVVVVFGHFQHLSFFDCAFENGFYEVKGCKCMYICIENYYVLRTCQTVQESLICGTGTLPSVLQTAVCQKRGRAIVLCINGTMKTFLPSLATTTISWTCCWSNCKFFERTMSPVFSLMLKVRPGSDWRRLMAYRTNELRLPGASSSRAKT